MDSLLDLDTLLEPRANVISTEFDYRRYLNEMGMKWRREHNLPELDPDEAGRLYTLRFPTVAMEYQFP